MVDKKPAADNWPVVSGDYIVGDPESPVAVTTLASHNEDVPAAAGAAHSEAVGPAFSAGTQLVYDREDEQPAGGHPHQRAGILPQTAGTCTS